MSEECGSFLEDGIPCIPLAHTDPFFWHYDRKWLYFVKRGYMLVQHLAFEASTSTEDHQIIECGTFYEYKCSFKKEHKFVACFYWSPCKFVACFYWSSSYKGTSLPRETL